MKKLLAIFGAAGLVIWLVGIGKPLPLIGQTSKSEEVTLKGEVVDLHCYVTRGAKGPEHAACSNACISRGVSVGFLSEDGKLHLLLDEKPFSVKEKVANLANQPVKVTGTLVERDGVRAILLKSIAQVKPGS